QTDPAARDDPADAARRRKTCQQPALPSHRHGEEERVVLATGERVVERGAPGDGKRLYLDLSAAAARPAEMTEVAQEPVADVDRRGDHRTRGEALRKERLG